MPSKEILPRTPRAVLRTNPYCEPLRTMYRQLEQSGATSWNQVEAEFLTAMSAFDAGLPVTFEGPDEDKRRQSKELSAAIQNGKGDWFNNVLASLLERCAGIDRLYVRRRVPGLIIPEHNLDGVYPGDERREIEFLLEAKMMGTPKHANSPGEKALGRAGSADTNKRVKELAFKSIDLKGEAARRLAMVGVARPSSGGPKRPRRLSTPSGSIATNRFQERLPPTAVAPASRPRTSSNGSSIAHARSCMG